MDGGCLLFGHLWNLFCPGCFSQQFICGQRVCDHYCVSFCFFLGCICVLWLFCVLPGIFVAADPSRIFWVGAFGWGFFFLGLSGCSSI